jgi:hypothetical protein
MKNLKYLEVLADVEKRLAEFETFRINAMSTPAVEPQAIQAQVEPVIYEEEYELEENDEKTGAFGFLKKIFTKKTSENYEDETVLNEGQVYEEEAEEQNKVLGFFSKIFGKRKDDEDLVTE